MVQKGVSDAAEPFTVPASSDFTDGTWTVYDLLDREIGINTGSGKMFVRIDNTIYSVRLDDIAGDPFDQVNSDWAATSGVAQILNKPSIPTATSDLTDDVGFLTNVTGLIDVDSSLGMSGSGTTLDPYVIRNASPGLRNGKVFSAGISTGAGDPSHAVYTVDYNDNVSTNSVEMRISIKEIGTNDIYSISFNAISSSETGTIVSKITPLTGGDINKTGNAYTVIADVDTVDQVVRYFVVTTSGTSTADLTFTYSTMFIAS